MKTQIRYETNEMWFVTLKNRWRYANHEI